LIDSAAYYTVVHIMYTVIRLISVMYWMSKHSIYLESSTTRNLQKC